MNHGQTIINIETSSWKPLIHL